jgi:hypothetical protein
VSVVCCQVKVSATGRSLLQRNTTKCVSLCVIKYNNILYTYTRVKAKEIVNPLLSVITMNVFSWPTCVYFLAYLFIYLHYCIKPGCQR